MKEFWFNNIDDYLQKADTYSDPKTIKMYEIVDVEGKKVFRSITYLRTALIGYEESVSGDKADERLKILCDKVKGHGHSEGHMREVAPLKM